jgi:hypothetical protein
MVSPDYWIGGFSDDADDGDAVKDEEAADDLFEHSMCCRFVRHLIDPWKKIGRPKMLKRKTRLTIRQRRVGDRCFWW